MSRYKINKPTGELIGLDSPMVGATNVIDGAGGEVPAPKAGEQYKFLRGDGTWQDNTENFVGTSSQWESLSTFEKKQYKTADILQSYTITYNSNNSFSEIEEIEEIEQTAGTVHTIYNAETFSAKEYYEFGSWNTQPDGRGITYYPGDEFLVVNNLVLYAQWILGLKFSSDDNFTLSVNQPGWLQVENPGYIEYSINNGIDWATWDGSELSGDINHSIYLRGKNNTVITDHPNFKWIFTGKYIIGNIETLLDWEIVTNGQHPTMEKDCYYGMFYGGCTSLTIAPELPAITLADNCYNLMFYGCTSLTTAPSLPATTLADSCYYDMFTNCTSLTTAPELPVITLADSCYQSMFRNCTSLIIAPELPAITLADSCYSSMFRDCTSLTTAPELPATTLKGECYSSMFLGCTSLITPPELPATTLVHDCYWGMFYGCTKLTTAPSLPATTLAEGCYINMFYDCTSLTTAPLLPATTLAGMCYRSMFSGCTSLTTAPKLPATTLAEYCYKEMFYGCTSLKISVTSDSTYQYPYRIPTSDTGTIATNALTDMFVNTGGTFTETPTINTIYYTDHESV